MESEVAFVNELVRQVREAHQVPLEAVSRIADLAISSIHRYEVGEREVSIRYFRALHELTADPRLLRYFCAPIAQCVQWTGGQCRCSLCQARRDQLQLQQASMPFQPPPPGDPGKLLPDELTALGELTEAAKYVARIVADGKVDDSDDTAIAQLLAKHTEVRGIMDAADRALIAWRERSPK